MIGIVLVSHSEKLAEGVKELSSQMAPEVKIEAAGGARDGWIGTDMNKIINAIQNVYSEDGVLIFFDLGSALMNTEMAIDFLEEDMKENIYILDAPIAEGAVFAAIDVSLGKNISEIKENLKHMQINKMQ